MPNRFKGSVQDRLDRLDRIGRRCDANDRRCVNPAVDVYELVRADGFGMPIQGERIQTKQACGRHRLQFLENGCWAVANRHTYELSERRTPRPPAA
jgi:hypothetical protein